MYNFFNYGKSTENFYTNSEKGSLFGIVIGIIKFLHAHPYITSTAILIAQAAMTEACNLCYNLCMSGANGSHRTCWARCFCGGDL